MLVVCEPSYVVHSSLEGTWSLIPLFSHRFRTESSLFRSKWTDFPDESYNYVVPHCPICDFWGGGEACYDLRTTCKRFKSLYWVEKKPQTNFETFLIGRESAVTL